MDLQEMTYDTFAPLLNHRFRLNVKEFAEVEAELIEATSRDTEGRSFSLIFRFPLETHFNQGTFPLQHEKLGDFALFMVPVKQDEQGRHYQAIFNRSSP
ncbi:MAG: hypothetical protein AB4290_29955 [Spirulina sp.]